MNTKGNINITYLMKKSEQGEFLYYINDKNKNSKEIYENKDYRVKIYKQHWSSLDRIMTILDLLFEIHEKKI